MIEFEVPPFDYDYLRSLKRELIDTCSICHGSGVECVCQDQFEFEKAMSAARIPIKYRRMTFDSVDAPEAQPVKELIFAYIEQMAIRRSSGIGFYLWSNTTGTGKSLLAYLLLKEALKRGYSCRVTNLSEIVTCLVSKEEGIKEDFKEWFRRADFVVIDDLGAEYMKSVNSNELLKSLLTEEFKERAEASRPTIITSNFSKEQLKDAFGGRLNSRFYEELVEVECKGGDYRKQILNKDFMKRDEK